MDTREAALKVTLNRFKAYCQAYGSHQQLNTAILYLQNAAQLGERRNQTFHSIRWNRARVSIKRAIASELQNIDIQILDAIDQAGYCLNLYCEAIALDATASSQEQMQMYAEAIANLTQAKNEIKRFYPQGTIARQLTLMDIQISCPR